MINSSLKVFPFLFLGTLIYGLGTPPASAELKNFQKAKVVLGQPDFTQGTANNGGRSAATLNFPFGVFSDGRRLFVAEFSNTRVLIWNSIPTTNFAPSDVVLGQPDFASATANNGGRGANTLSVPTAVFSDGKRLFVLENQNHRLLIFNNIPTTNFAPADVVLGQPDFTVGAPNSENGEVGANTLNAPRGAFSDGRRLFVADFSNHRVLIWNTIPTTNFASANVVLGQPDFTSNTANNGGRGARTLDSPNGVFSDGKRLFVSDGSNHRLLIWNSIPTTNFAPSDVVLGQPDFTQATANNGGRSARTFNSPNNGVFSDRKRLFVSDLTNNRVLIWNSIPTTNFAPADVVLGQPDLTSGTANNGGRGAGTLSSPFGLFSDGKRLFAADRLNHRILIFDIAGFTGIELGPQFEQGKAVVGKVFWDWNGNGVQDVSKERMAESGIEGVKVASDTGIYALTDEDGKYHYPYIETGQRVLKIDPSTLPEGAVITTESPRKITVTKGILTKVSFGVRYAEAHPSQSQPPAPSPKDGPLLKVSLSQDPALLKPRLSMSAEKKEDKLFFTIDCNYFLFIERSELILYDKDYKKIRQIPLPQPLPLKYELPLKEIPPQEKLLFYQLSVFDQEGREDRTGVGRIEVK